MIPFRTIAPCDGGGNGDGQRRKGDAGTHARDID
jgi:hypothetical protein